MSTHPDPDDLQIPLLTEVVEDGEEGGDEDDQDEITQPHEHLPISRMEINFIVQSTLAKYLVLAGKEISEKLHRQIKERSKDHDDE